MYEGLDRKNFPCLLQSHKNAPLDNDWLPEWQLRWSALLLVSGSRGVECEHSHVLKPETPLECTSLGEENSFSRNPVCEISECVSMVVVTSMISL